MQSLSEISKAQTNNVVGQIRYYGSTSEFEPITNKYSRSIIRAFRREHGSAWLGNVNLYGDARGKPMLKEYKRGMVYNFQCSFIIPEYNQELEQLILDRDNAPSTGTKDDCKLIDAIFDKIEALNGLSLHWV